MINQTSAWQALANHQQDISELHLCQQFLDDPQRFERFSLSLGDILFDYSKNRITEKTMALLVDLAYQADLAGYQWLTCFLPAHPPGVGRHSVRVPGRGGRA